MIQNQNILNLNQLCWYRMLQQFLPGFKVLSRKFPKLSSVRSKAVQVISGPKSRKQITRLTVNNLIIFYPPTPADARGSAPGNNNYSVRILTVTDLPSVGSISSVSSIWTCADVDKKFHAEHCLVWLHIESLHGLEDLPMRYQKFGTDFCASSIKYS